MGNWREKLSSPRLVGIGRGVFRTLSKIKDGVFRENSWLVIVFRR